MSRHEVRAHAIRWRIVNEHGAPWVDRQTGFISPVSTRFDWALFAAKEIAEASIEIMPEAQLRQKPVLQECLLVPLPIPTKVHGAARAKRPNKQMRKQGVK